MFKFCAKYKKTEIKCGNVVFFLTFPHFIPLFILNFDVRDKKLADCKILYFEKNHKCQINKPQSHQRKPMPDIRNLNGLSDSQTARL